MRMGLEDPRIMEDSEKDVNYKLTNLNPERNNRNEKILRSLGLKNPN